MSTKVLTDLLASLAYEEVVTAQQKIDNHGKQFTSGSTQAGIDMVNMISHVRIANALERIAECVEKATGNVKSEDMG